MNEVLICQEAKNRGKFGHKLNFRINLARLVYYNPDIVLLDDPLSAVDTHVGKFLFDQCINGILKQKTRVLVTHQLHVLPKVDYIYVIKNGKITEHGTYPQLIENAQEFSALMKSYGGEGDETRVHEEIEISKMDVDRIELALLSDKGKNGAREIMQKEERSTGSVKSTIWMTYFKAAGGWNAFIIPCLLLSIIVQIFAVGTNYWLAIWTNGQIQSFSQLNYITVYLGISVGSSIMAYLFGVL